MRFTKDSLAFLKIDVPFSQLPKTFQDAISVARRLRVRYIWIDSPCIIQDSTGNWTREARTMLKVYKHALYNIAATDSANSFGGLFSERDPAVLTSNILDVVNGPDVSIWLIETISPIMLTKPL